MHASNQGIGGAIGAGYGNMAQQTMAGPEGTRQSEVATETSRLTRAIDTLGLVSAELANRLMMVRRQTGNVANKEPNPPEPMLCSMADGIRSLRKEVELHAALLQTVINELEI